jgi:hypothetical protein
MEDEMPSVPSDSAIKFHSGLDSSINRWRESR